MLASDPTIEQTLAMAIPLGLTIIVVCSANYRALARSNGKDFRFTAYRLLAGLLGVIGIIAAFGGLETISGALERFYSAYLFSAVFLFSWSEKVRSAAMFPEVKRNS